MNNKGSKLSCRYKAVKWQKNIGIIGVFTFYRKFKQLIEKYGFIFFCLCGVRQYSIAITFIVLCQHSSFCDGNIAHLFYILDIICKAVVQTNASISLLKIRVLCFSTPYSYYKSIFAEIFNASLRLIFPLFKSLTALK